MRFLHSLEFGYAKKVLEFTLKYVILSLLLIFIRRTMSSATEEFNGKVDVKTVKAYIEARKVFETGQNRPGEGFLQVFESIYKSIVRNDGKYEPICGQ